MSGSIGKQISKARDWLISGETVAIPTETVYGLAANAFDKRAVAKIFAIKQRPSFNPLIVHIKRFVEIFELSQNIPVQAIELAQHFWPGPLTLLLDKKNIVPDLVTAGSMKVGIRVPAHPMSLKLLKSLPFPLAAPSANTFQCLSPTSPKHVFEDLGDKIPYILDGGTCTVGIESTVIGFEKDKTLIYRQGGISINKLRDVVGTVDLNKTTEKVLSPGMLKKHYTPNIPLVLGHIPDLINNHRNKKIGILAFKKKYPYPCEQAILSVSGDYLEAAHNFFETLHHLQSLDIELICAEPLPEMDLGIAINDRLRRATYSS